MCYYSISYNVTIVSLKKEGCHSLMVEDLDVNRTSLSAFVNKTYGMNFSRYLNRLRFRELEELRLQPENEGKTIGSLLNKAGFDNYRTYLRAVNAEREGGTA